MSNILQITGRNRKSCRYRQSFCDTAKQEIDETNDTLDAESLLKAETARPREEEADIAAILLSKKLLLTKMMKLPLSKNRCANRAWRLYQVSVRVGSPHSVATFPHEPTGPQPSLRAEFMCPVVVAAVAATVVVDVAAAAVVGVDSALSLLPLIFEFG
jgi:hypothetical protein